MRRFEHARHYLLAHPLAASLLPALERNARVLLATRRHLRSPLAAHCEYTVLEDDGQLVLITDSPVWATRLRFAAPALQQGLLRDLGEAVTVRVRVRPGGERPSTPQGGGKRLRLAPEVVEHLESAAAGLADEGLAESLRRLARAGAGG